MAQKKLSILTELTLNAAGFDKGIDGAKEKFSSLRAGTEKASGAIKDAFANVGEMFSPMTGQLSGLQSGIMNGITAFKAMVPAINGIKMAFISTGIGAIVVALGVAFAALVSWIKRTDEGSDGMRKVFDVVKAVINTLLDKLAVLGSAIVKLFKGDFQGAWADAKSAFTGWGDAIDANVKKAGELNAIQDKLEDFNETAALNRAKIEERISSLQEKARDTENYNANQRLAFTQKLRAAYLDLYNVNKQGFDLELAALQKEVSTNGNNQELRQKINEKQAEGLRLQAEYNNNITSTTRLYNKTRGEIAAATEQQRKLNAEQLKAKQIEDMKGVEKMNPHYTINKSTSDIVKTLTARQNTYAESVLNSRNAWMQLRDTMKDTGFIADTVTGAFSYMGEALGSVFTGQAASFKDFVSTMLGGLKQILNGLLAQAIAGMLAGEAKKGLIGLAAGVVGVGALTAIWQSKVPKFAFGGIVPGSSFYGDRVPVMANSGEMILNAGQQASLFKMINGGGMHTDFSRVEFEIRGDKLIGAINNTNRKRGRI